ncbi:MAG: putative isochorismatase hydrolase [Acidimicrobiales bacterium]|nr:MAG: putative isochorismatase hydrolase [Acidimicrobiales bacterium]
MIVAESTPYAWPYDGRLVPGRTALVVCGAAGEWAHRTSQDRTVEANIEVLRHTSTACGVLVVLVRQAPDPSTSERTAQPSVGLIPEPAEQAVVAIGVDGFYGSPLDAVLHRHGRTHLLFAGRGFETTIHSTLRRANDRGYECLTVADACATVDPRMRDASISTIEMSGGIFGAVASTASVILALRHEPEPEPNEGAP